MSKKESRSSISAVNTQGFNFLKLVRNTLRVDRKKYHNNPRPTTLDRLFKNLSPNLNQPIFLIGSPRSGTTFLGACLEKIPGISYHFEPIATKFAANYIFSGEWELQKSQRYYRRMYSWLMQQHLDGDLRFAEKTPRNCFLVDFLYTTFPDAQFIHIIRDGRDAALSHSKKTWMQAAQANDGGFEPGGFRIGPYARFWVERERVAEFESTSDIHRCIWAWRRHTESALKAAVNLPEKQYHELRYEALVAKPNQEADRLLAFLGIHGKTARTCLHEAVSQVQSTSVGQWRKQLSDEDLRFVYREAKEALECLGYLKD
ncbi:MAG: sulfotransferase [Leptolyngbya sp. SIO1D8]|nr:sulfotransferase [Leptolyngbya sp. SIO1D8]